MEYLHNDKEQFREAIALTGYQTGVAAEIIEKDYLLPLVPQDEGFKMLVNEVRKIRATSTICPSAKSDVIIPELLQEIVEKEIYKADYESLTVRLLDDDANR